MAEKKYIDHKKFNSKLNYIIRAYGLSGVISEKIKKAIKESEAADVEPVKHGHWIVTEYYNPSEFGEEKAYTFKCSECGNAYHSTMGMSYCMDCGAKMDGEEVQE